MKGSDRYAAHDVVATCCCCGREYDVRHFSLGGLDQPAAGPERCGSRRR